MAIIQDIVSILIALAPYAWPLAIVIIVLILRRPISQVIQSLQKFSYKGVEATFRERIAELDKKADQAKIPNQIPESALSDEDAQFYEEIKGLAELIPEAAITNVWDSKVQPEIIATVKRLDYPSPLNPRPGDPTLAIRLLRLDSSIDEETASILNGMRRLRNMVGQYVDYDQISRTEAIEYTRLAKRMVEKLRSIKPEQRNTSDSN